MFILPASIAQIEITTESAGSTLRGDRLDRRDHMPSCQHRVADELRHAAVPALCLNGDLDAVGAAIIAPLRTYAILP